MHVPPLRRSNSWSSGVSRNLGGSALALKATGAVTVVFVFVTSSHVDVVVFIAALTASVPFRILILTSNIGQTSV